MSRMKKLYHFQEYLNKKSKINVAMMCLIKLESVLKKVIKNLLQNTLLYIYFLKNRKLVYFKGQYIKVLARPFFCTYKKNVYKDNNFEVKNTKNKNTQYKGGSQSIYKNSLEILIREILPKIFISYNIKIQIKNDINTKTK